MRHNLSESTGDTICHVSTRMDAAQPAGEAVTID